MTDKKNYFEELNKIECKTDEKNKLTYVSWTDAWTEVKKVYPESNYIIYEYTILMHMPYYINMFTPC